MTKKTSVTVRLEDNLLKEVKIIGQSLNISQTEYIRKAIEHMNHEVLKNERDKKITEASLKVRNESMLINEEFSKTEEGNDVFVVFFGERED
jgi:hypothetical protein